MATAEIEPARPKKVRQSFVSALVAAFLEWFLILFLFIDAMISYVITKFARGCKLQTPCLLCSRLDHVLGKEKMGYYWDLMCRDHKSEVSSLVLCHAHNKLVDVHKMCENCLFSFATINKSNAETYRLLVGKLGEDLNSDVDQDPCLVDDQVSFLSRRDCACCSQPWVPRAHTHAEELIQTRFVALEGAEFESPLSHSIEHDHGVTKSGRDRSVSLTATQYRKGGVVDPLSHIGYTELKINSDTESEVLPSDDEDGASARAVIRERVINKHEFSFQRIEPQIVTLDDDLASEKLLDPAPAPVPKSSIMESQGNKECTEPQIVTLDDDLASEKLLDRAPVPNPSIMKSQGNEECTEPHIVTLDDDLASEKLLDPAPVPKPSTMVSQENEESTEPQIVTLDDDLASEKLLDPAPVPKPPIMGSQGDEESTDPSDCKPQESTSAIGHGLEEINWHDLGNKAESIATPAETTVHSASQSDVIESPVEVSENSFNVAITGEVGETSVAKSEYEEVLDRGAPSNRTAETGLETSAVASDSGQKVTNSLDLGDAYKLAVDNRGKQLSGSLADQWLGKDSSRITEDLRVLLSQLSSKGGFDLPISPKLSVNSDDQKTLDPSSSIGMQMLQKKFSLERNESGLSLDGSIISEIEGETVVDRLKRQVEHDKKLMTALYKELEEERNASAVATNQAMAMITRLQEEKAALHMEALQYLRMMEEQAEYDDDELQKSNDLLTEKEKEVQDLEAELEYYKKKLPNERFFENLSETNGDMSITDIGVDNSEYNCIRDDASVSIHPISGTSDSYDKNVDKVDSNSPILEFEDEKAYILQCVKKLEKTLDLLSDEEVITNLSKNDELNHKAQDNDEAEESVSPLQHDTLASVQDFHDEEMELNGRETVESHLTKPSSAELSQATDLDSLRTTVSSLNKRLEALEADRRFLEHTMNSLRNGDEGVRFIQEIASHLQELRKIATQRDQLVA